jgi:hypothetical protein
MPHAISIAVTRELGEQSSTLLNELSPQIRMFPPSTPEPCHDR